MAVCTVLFLSTRRPDTYGVLGADGTGSATEAAGTAR